jgi:hypothetical protein
MNRFRWYFKRIRDVLKLCRVDRDKYAATTTICIATTAMVAIIVIAIAFALQPQFKTMILNLRDSMMLVASIIVDGGI